MSINVHVEQDGSFSLSCDSIQLTGCYPGIDGQPLRAIGIDVTRSKDTCAIDYHTGDGTVHLSISSSGDAVEISTRLALKKSAPCWFYPIYRATQTGCRGMYRQGKGIIGPSGFVSLETFKKNDDILDMFRSWGQTSLVGENNVLTAFALTHRRFSTRFDVTKLDHEDYRELFSAGYATEGISATELELPVLRLTQSKNLETGLESAAHTIAQTVGVSLKAPPLVWCSWYYHYQNFSSSILSEYLEKLSSLSPEIPLTTIQIDAGYFPSAGDWLVPGPLWPEGMEQAFTNIVKHGFTAGIWIAPFMVANRSKLFVEHPDWILRRHDGSPVVEMSYYNEAGMWGYRDEEYYTLDTSNPQALDYLRMVFRTFRKWGARYFKTDYMFWGMHDSTTVKRHTPGKTSVEYMVEVCTMIREEIGQESFWLGCIAPFGPLIGFVDAMRIAGDVGARWEGQFGADNLIREAVGSNYLNHIFWHNDPDAMILRDFHTHLKEHEVETLCLLQAVSGGLVCTSDPLHEIAASRQDLFRFVTPQGKRRPRIPFLDSERNDVVMTHSLGNGRYLIFVLNPTENALTTGYSIKELVGSKAAYVHHWNTGSYTEQKESSIHAVLPSRACALFFISEDEVLNRTLRTLWEWD